MGADRHYASCLSFHEPRVADKESDNFLDEDDDEDVSLSPSKRSFVEGPVLYRPKCLVIVSRRPHFELFRVRFLFIDMENNVENFGGKRCRLMDSPLLYSLCSLQAAEKNMILNAFSVL